MATTPGELVPDNTSGGGRGVTNGNGQARQRKEANMTKEKESPEDALHYLT
jgi:hypothetical protein